MPFRDVSHHARYPASAVATDAYLAALARHHKGKLVSFDRGLVALHADVAVGLDEG